MKIQKVRRRAKKLSLRIATHKNSHRVHGVIYDRLSNWSTLGNVFNGKDRACMGFLKRLRELRTYIGYECIYRGDPPQVIFGLRDKNFGKKGNKND